MALRAPSKAELLITELHCGLHYCSIIAATARRGRKREWRGHKNECKALCVCVCGCDLPTYQAWHESHSSLLCVCHLPYVRLLGVGIIMTRHMLQLWSVFQKATARMAGRGERGRERMREGERMRRFERVHVCVSWREVAHTWNVKLIRPRLSFLWWWDCF